MSTGIFQPLFVKMVRRHFYLHDKLILEHQEKEINLILERNNLRSALVHFGNETLELPLKTVSLTSFK